MRKEHSINLQAGALQKALTTMFPKRGKVSGSRPNAVTITYDQKQKHLCLEEARHGLSGYSIPAEGTWPGQVQVNAVLLKRICEKFKAEDIIELVPLRDELCLLVKAARITLKRLDSKNEPGIKQKP